MFQKGLKGVVAVQTAIAEVDGQNGRLMYRGRTVEELLPGRSYEEVAAFLWDGELPGEARLEEVDGWLKEGRKLPDHVQALLDVLPEDMEIMDAARTAISAYSHPEFRSRPIREQAALLTGALPVIVSAHYRKRSGLGKIAPDSALGQVANYLWMLTGEKPSPAKAEALGMYLKLTMEHGMNASTFAGRVTISTESDLTAAVTSALGAMKGPLHGGAPSGVIDLLEEVKASTSITEVIEGKLAAGEKIMGFGHRVYRTADPRSVLLRETCRGLEGQDDWLDLAVTAENEITRLLDVHKPGRKLYTNVEYYAAAVMRAIDMPPDLFTPTFSVARMVGWTAHAIEQIGDNTIFRPESEYVVQDPVGRPSS
ncbi:citrate synthase/methylcitrate synthase [Edaphobacillus lindanitolerans]|uniref:Citrate synthase n=1 Tax=Edaphobacillus lindanitolerans TaxID=550447 RepID=A0A1U7PLL7_9BACI|nr:citrate synthase/methylcitrate synthase [Edaphobacillus lindanitolerans]SIT88101.1 citrate synthase [Edaphobacillus lindanitolerans]